MSLSLFSALAAAVTVGGLVAVVWAARLARVVPAARRKSLALGVLLICALVLALRPAAWPAIDLAVLAGAAGAVVLIEGALQNAASVAVFLAVAGTVDFLSMSTGISRVLVERYRSGSSDLLVYLSLVIPVHGRPLPIVGVSDLFVAGSAAAALLRLGLRPAAVMGTIVAGLLAALAYGLWRGGAPALPFVAAAVCALVWRHSRVTRIGKLGT